MNNLVRVIGPAPSELPFSDFLTRLKVERKRIIDEIANFRRVSTKVTYASEISQILKETGMTPQELEKLIQQRAHDK